MGVMARKFNAFYCDYKKKFKKPISTVAEIMPVEFTDAYFVDTFKRLYPNLWKDLEEQYEYWHKKNDELIKHGKKSRYNFRKPYNFILDCSYNHRRNLRNDTDRVALEPEHIKSIEDNVLKKSLKKVQKKQQKINKNMYHVQEIEPIYAKVYIDEYFRTHDLHERLEIMRELSKYKSDEIVSFFYKVNACTRNFSLKEESMHYIQGLGLPFKLRGKKKGKKTYIDNEKVYNDSSPEILMKRLYVDRLERIKRFDMFISHSSKNEEAIVQFYKALNTSGYVAYVDWVNDKYDLKRQWCNATTAEIIKERIKQSQFFVVYVTEDTLQSQWCAWELGYADALGKKICVYLNGAEMKILPQFFWSYPTLDISPKLSITKDEKRIDLKQWLNGKEE
jgi:hypothetical protein